MQSNTQLHHPQSPQWSLGFDMVVRIGKIGLSLNFGTVNRMPDFTNESFTKEAGR
ncbi:MAG: hypothetical protein ABI162_16260 [Luteolibacter sp.]